MILLVANLQMIVSYLMFCYVLTWRELKGLMAN